MTTLESVCEEKLSPNKSPQATRTHEVLEKEKSITKDDATYNDGGRTADGVLDEIAAKVHNMGMTDGDEDDDVGVTNHEKCMETVRSQGETINTLINQLRVMFEEYTSMNNEREYYEELNEALFRCLELNDGTVAVESDTDDDDGGEEGTAGATIGEKNDSEVVMTKQETTSAKKTGDADNSTPGTEKMSTDLPSSSSSSSSKKKQETPMEEEDEDMDSESVGSDDREVDASGRKIMKKVELQKINEVLLRDLFELRHQMEVLKQGFRDYLDSEELSQSDYDTAEDEHQCQKCRPSIVRNQDGSSQTSEDYQFLENDTVEIANETDSD